MSSQNPKKNLRRGALAALASVALLLGSTLAATPAQAVPDDGKGEVVVKIVDAAGKATAGFVSLVSVDESDGPESGGTYNPVAGTYTFSVDEGRYGVLSMTPWGGVMCAGVTPCDYYAIMSSGAAATITGVVDVTDTETPVTYTMRTTAPAVLTGGNTVGQALTVDWSDGMDRINALFGVSSAAAAPAVQWFRDGALLSATGPSYTATAADAGHTVSARLSYPTPIVWSVYGGNPAPVTLTGRKIGKVKTRTTVQVFRSTIDAGRSGGFRADVTSAGASPTGKVRIVIGKLKMTKTLRNGSIRGVLPKSLKAGKYTVVATYLGSSTYLGSKGKDKLTVKPARK